MLAIHIINVGHGDSIVIEYKSPEGTAYGVIDSNRVYGKRVPALKKLKELGAERLSFVALTHPHADHYSGLLDILEEYRGRVDFFYSFPLDHHKEGRLKKLAKIYADIYQNTDGLTARSVLAEYVKILLEVQEHIGLDNWEEHTGLYSCVAPTGFAGVDIQVIMPPASIKGEYFKMIQNDSYDIVEKENLNALSLAFLVSFKGHQIVLGGDAIHLHWFKHQQLNRNRHQQLHATAAKLPHHGSKKECKPGVLKYIFAKDGERVACISANGRSHPHGETLAELQKQGVKPYCTNLARYCGAEERKLLVHDASHKPDLMLFLNRVLEEIPGESIQPCQGDVVIHIDDDGELKTNTEYDLLCPYRDSYEFMSQ